MHNLLGSVDPSVEQTRILSPSLSEISVSTSVPTSVPLVPLDSVLCSQESTNGTSHVPERVSLDKLLDDDVEETIVIRSAASALEFECQGCLNGTSQDQRLSLDKALENPAEITITIPAPESSSVPASGSTVLPPPDPECQDCINGPYQGEARQPGITTVAPAPESSLVLVAGLVVSESKNEEVKKQDLEELQTAVEPSVEPFFSLNPPAIVFSAPSLSSNGSSTLSHDTGSHTSFIFLDSQTSSTVEPMRPPFAQSDFNLHSYGSYENDQFQEQATLTSHLSTYVPSVVSTRRSNFWATDSKSRSSTGSGPRSESKSADTRSDRFDSRDESSEFSQLSQLSAHTADWLRREYETNVDRVSRPLPNSIGTHQLAQVVEEDEDGGNSENDGGSRGTSEDSLSTGLSLHDSEEA